MNKSNLRILVVSQHFPPEKSGNASRIHDMCINLSKNAQVTIFAPFPSFPHGSFKRQPKLRSFKEINPQLKLMNLGSWQPEVQDPNFASRMLYYFIFPIHASIWALINSRRYDLIITSAPPIFTSITGIFAKSILRKKWIIDVRDLWIDASISLGFLKKGGISEKLSRYFMKICYQRADLVCTTTEGVAINLKSEYDLEKLVIIPNGVDPDYFYPGNAPKKNRIIYAGNVGHAQDLKNCILAMKKIIEYRDIVLMIVGDGDIRKDLEDLVRHEDLEKHVEFKGLVPRNKIPEMISESLVGIAPLKKLNSLNYAAPTKVFEYMACGIPFMGCGNGEIRRLAKQSGAGIIADNDPEDMAKVIIDLVDNPEKSQKMGEKGRSYVLEHYDRKKIALDLYHHINTILYNQLTSNLTNDEYG